VRATDNNCSTLTHLQLLNDITVSEVLWFLNSQFSKMPKKELCSLMSTSYTFEEVAIAKKLLFDFLKAMQVDYLPVFTEKKCLQVRINYVLQWTIC